MTIKFWEGVFYFLPRFLYNNKRVAEMSLFFLYLFFHTTKVQQFPETTK